MLSNDSGKEITEIKIVPGYLEVCQRGVRTGMLVVEKRQKPRRQRKRLLSGALVILLPFLVMFALFVVIPALYAVYMSLFSSQGSLFSQTFVGFANYVRAIHDAGFWVAVVRMIVFGVIEVTLMLFLSSVLAILINNRISRLNTVYRIVYFLPYAVPGAIAGLLWGYMYDPAFGPLGIIGKMLFGSGFNFLAPENLLVSLLNVVLWSTTGFSVILLLAALSSVPQSVCEAARLDGASSWIIATKIKLPMIRSMLYVVAIISLAGMLELFNKPYVFRALAAVQPTFTPNLDIYLTSFSYGNIHYAATLAVVLTVVTLGTIGILLVVVPRIRFRNLVNIIRFGNRVQRAKNRAT